MNTAPFTSTLRQVRADMTRQTALVVMIAVGLILGVSGPFETLQMLPLIPRTLYWLAVVVLSFFAGSMVDGLIGRIFPLWPLWQQLVLSTVAIGSVVTVILLGLNGVAFGYMPAGLRDFTQHWIVVTVISGVVTVGSALVQPSAPSVPLLDRLPYDKRGPLIALSAEDHYVRVETTKGHEMILMRLSDAIKEVGSTKGIQIHRSHWVALDAITAAARNGDRGEITLSNANTRPISRSFLPAVKEAGLLPKRHG